MNERITYTTFGVLLGLLAFALVRILFLVNMVAQNAAAG